MAEGSQPKPFPAVTGGCYCSTIRYRLLTPPLFCFACHCPSCQKRTGSAFSLHLLIEFFAIQTISPTRPIITPLPVPRGTEQWFICGKCKTHLWTTNFHSNEGLCDVRIGTLDFPSLMEPDVHCFVESKLDWVGLPKEARLIEGKFRMDMWPKSSMRRFENMQLKLVEAKKRMAGQKGAGGASGAIGSVDGTGAKSLSVENGGAKDEATEDSNAEGEKTPTAVEFDEEDDGEGEDDEAFEKRYKETEKALRKGWKS